MPALPRDLFNKYTHKLGLSAYDAYNLTDSKEIALYYEELITFSDNYKSCANWIMGDVKSYLNQYGKDITEFPISPKALSGLIKIIDDGKVSSTVASQKIFPVLIDSPDKDALKIAEDLNLIQDSDEDSILGFIQTVINQNPTEIERYKNGEKQLIGFFMGQLMKASKGKADPKSSNQLMRNTLDNL